MNYQHLHVAARLSPCRGDVNEQYTDHGIQQGVRMILDRQPAKTLLILIAATAHRVLVRTGVPQAE